MNDDLFRSQPDGLARLLSIDGDRPPAWRREELSDILHHQLRAPLVFDLGRLGEAVAPPAADACGRPAAAAAVPGGLYCFGDLLYHASPPIELLVLAKQFAKTADRGGPLPSQIATFLYYAVIVVALLRHRARISRLSDETLRDGLRWLAGQPWLDARARGLVAEGLAALPEAASPAGSGDAPTRGCETTALHSTAARLT